MKKYIIFFSLAFIISCSSGNKNNTTNADSQSATKNENTNQFNITILQQTNKKITSSRNFVLTTLQIFTYLFILFNIFGGRKRGFENL